MNVSLKTKYYRYYKWGGGDGGGGEWGWGMGGGGVEQSLTCHNFNYKTM